MTSQAQVNFDLIINYMMTERPTYCPTDFGFHDNGTKLIPTGSSSFITGWSVLVLDTWCFLTMLDPGQVSTLSLLLGHLLHLLLSREPPEMERENPALHGYEAEEERRGTSGRLSVKHVCAMKQSWIFSSENVCNYTTELDEGLESDGSGASV